MTAAVELPPELIEKLRDPQWRIYSGAIYKIIVKGDDDEDGEGLVLPFIPNRAQRRLLQKLHHRNVILKARQLGFTTLICMLWLDTALFSRDPIRCGIIAQDKEAAENIFRGKILFAYDNLPEEMRQMFPLSKRTSTEIEFAHNGASIRVATSMRSGTIHRLHISEHGKICAKYPDKAKEVATGSIPAVPKSGILVIESTAEGQDGDFYKITQRAEALDLQGAKLSAKDYRFHFFPWWEAPEYVLPAGSVPLSPVDIKYFNELEAEIGRKISPEQRAWYVATRDNDFNGEAPLMWQEYPSTSKEAFQVSTEGCYYSTQLAKVREQGRIVRNLPILPIPVNTFWDLGRGDMTTIWLHQRSQMQDRFHRYYENSGEDLSHYVTYLLTLQQELRITYGTHYLPHDAEYKRLGISPDTNKSIKEMLEDLLPGHRFQIVPRISSLQAGIEATRAAFASAWFDEEGTKHGVARLGAYRKRWNKILGCWSDEAVHDDASHASDAIRQWGQEVASGNIFSSNTVSSGTFKRRGSAMAR